MPAYSHSRLETYQNCPRQYYLRYIDKPDIPEYQGIEAFMGSRVHDALEKLYKDLMLTKLNTLDDLRKYYLWAWDKEWNDQVRIVRKGFAQKHYRDAGLKAIGNYYRRYQPFDQSITISTEQLIAFKVDGYSIQGFIDRLSHDGRGRYEIHDYKSGGHLPSQADFEADRQLALYEIGIREMYPGIKDVKLCWHYVLFDQEFVSRRTPAQLKDLKRQVVSQIRAIEKDDQFKPVESKLCDWCGYQEFCPAKSHELKVEGLPANKYLKEKGVALVNKYASLQSRIGELNRRIREIQAEQDLVAEAAVIYAHKQGTSKLVGSEHCLKIEHEKTIKFPGATDPEREPLEDLVRKAGLWDQASSLNIRTLRDLVESDEVAARYRRELLKFAQEEECDRVKLVNKKQEEK